MFAKLSFFWYLLLIAGGLYDEDPAPAWNVYSAYTDTGIHLIMTDAGTADPFDDFIVDYEDNRAYEIITTIGPNNDRPRIKFYRTGTANVTKYPVNGR